MFRVALLACLAVAALASPFIYDAELDPYWESFTATYNKQYAAEVEPMRRAIWEQNVKLIREHNLEADMGQHTYRLGINEYADWTNGEFVSFMNGYKMRNTTREGSLFIAPSNVNAAPDTVDWRKSGYVTGVKNQEQCGSCWAFSATGSTEGQHFKATKKLVSLSEQNLMDCSWAEGNLGCQGGLMDSAFKYMIKNKGVDTEDSYPYRARDAACKFKKSDVGATISGFTDVKSKDEDALKQAVATVGPVSVAIDASSEKFQLYKSGVYNDLRCSQTLLDHGVLAVGYGTENGQDYWLVKNSWGASWGMEGYINMSRNKNNQCGIATQASYPTI